MTENNRDLLKKLKALKPQSGCEQQLLIDEYRNQWISIFKKLLKVYPLHWYSGEFIYVAQAVITQLHSEWQQWGLSDEQFEIAFGGGEGVELIWYLFRPTASDFAIGQTEDYDPVIPGGLL
jgi:hypothetical protein